MNIFGRKKPPEFWAEKERERLVNVKKKEAYNEAYGAAVIRAERTRGARRGRENVLGRGGGGSGLSGMAARGGFNLLGNFARGSASALGGEYSRPAPRRHARRRPAQYVVVREQRQRRRRVQPRRQYSYDPFNIG